MRLSGGGQPSLSSFTSSFEDEVCETHLLHSAGDYRFAFTLAELLITLGIIGVVAAMTLPALINRNQDKILESQYAKAKTILSNGYKLMMAKSDTFEVENLPIFNTCDGFDCISSEHKKSFNIIADTYSGLDTSSFIKDYIIQGSDEPSPFKWDDVPYIFSTTDGMMFGLLPDSTFKSFSIVTDVNSSKNPNTVRKDLYKFRYSGTGRLTDISFELEELRSCSVNDTSACKTQEACNGLEGMPTNSGKCVCTTYWSSSSCYIGSFLSISCCK